MAWVDNRTVIVGDSGSPEGGRVWIVTLSLSSSDHSSEVLNATAILSPRPTSAPVLHPTAPPSRSLLTLGVSRAVRIDSSRLGLQAGDRFGSAVAVLSAKTPGGAPDTSVDLDGSPATLDIAVGASHVNFGVMKTRAPSSFCFLRRLSCYPPPPVPSFGHSLHISRQPLHR